MRLVIAAVMLVLLFAACGGGKGIPDNVLPPEKMQEVMWDVIKADVYASEYVKKDSTQNDTTANLKMQQTIFAIHNTTKEKYYRSYDYYKAKPELMKALMDTMSARVNRVRSRTPTIDKPPVSTAE
jgi:Domain of unknown function (DUF4296)